MEKPVRDIQSINADGSEIIALPHGVSMYHATPHVDERGSVCEMFNPDWGWNQQPMTYAYYFTVRPEKIKGWGVHELHEDRYFIMLGEVAVGLYDNREDSPTYKNIFKVIMSEQDRTAINIPAGVYHATHNIGDKDAMIANFPTRLYDRTNPEKYRLPLDTKDIPFPFDTSRGW